MTKSLYQNIFSEKSRYQLHIYLRKLQAVFLKGDRFYCPCCGKTASRFLRKGNGIEFRENAICPHCASLERTRLLYLYLKNETEIFINHPFILHFAPEDGLKKKLIENPNYFDVDLNPYLATYKMDITNIEFENNHFDYIICSHVLGHISDEKKALKELFRVLKSGGTLLIISLMNPDSEITVEDENVKNPIEKLRLYGEKDLERLYGNDFIERIKTDDITVEKIDYRQNFDFEQRKKMSLGNGTREIIYKIIKNQCTYNLP